MAPPTIPGLEVRPESPARESDKSVEAAVERKEPDTDSDASSIEQGAGVTKIESLCTFHAG